MTKRDPIANALDRVAQALFSNFENLSLDGYLPEITPIERIFLWEFMAHSILAGHRTYSRMEASDKWSEQISRSGFSRDWRTHPVMGAVGSHQRITIAREVGVGKYRCDFLIEMADLYELSQIEHGTPSQPGSRAYRHLAIECDGHDYHERTKQQAARDRSRDRYFLEQGLAVMRFTGSELYRDGPSCALQAINFLDPWAAKNSTFRERRESLSAFRKA